jgi:hypothetical protein
LVGQATLSLQREFQPRITGVNDVDITERNLVLGREYYEVIRQVKA